ncbi:MAG: hypothetical protein V7739_19465 [Motiliproteus sp.]
MSKSVEIICVLDRSGSMENIMDEAISAFNGFVDQQKKQVGKAKLTLAIFDDQYELLYDRIKLKQVPVLTIEDASPRGMTALYDAIGRTVCNAKPDRQTICLIQTDGMENSSQEYSAKKLKALVDDRTKKGWEFVFIGAGIDAFAAGNSFGLSIEQCVNVTNTSEGMKEFGEVLCQRSSSFRGGFD